MCAEPTCASTTMACSAMVAPLPNAGVFTTTRSGILVTGLLSQDVKSRELRRTSQLFTPVRQPSRYIKSCAKLTINLVHKIGQAVRVNCP